MEISTLLQSIFGTSIAFLLLYKAWKNIITHRKNKSRVKKLPEPPGSWPLIGHLSLLREQIPVYRILGAIADNHGPIFSIRLGTKTVMVVSSRETIKECIGTNDQVFLTRPASAASKYMGYGNAFFGLTTHIQYWRHVRKIATGEVLSNRRLELLKNVRASEVDTSIKELYSLCSKNRASSSCSAMVDMNGWVSTVILNILVGMVAGKRYSSNHDGEYGESRRFIKAIHDFMYLLGMNVVSDVIPGMEWLDLQGYVKSMKVNAKELDYFMSSWVEEHLRKRKDGKMKEERDFIDALISLMADEDEDGSIFGFKTQNVIKATVLNLIMGGTDTSSLTLIWALSLLLNHAQVLKAAQEELDVHIGKERWVEEADMKNLVYLQAIVKEVLRLYPAAPLGVPREAMEDCNVSGYHIPKGTRLLLNIWKLHRDSRIWTDPDEFKPERFLTTCHAHLDFRGQNFEYIPFGSGRRACPGISSGMQMVSLVLARLLQGFTMTTPMNEPVDMEEGLGITIAKAKPLNVMVSPRLPHALYQPC